MKNNLHKLEGKKKIDKLKTLSSNSNSRSHSCSSNGPNEPNNNENVSPKKVHLKRKKRKRKKKWMREWKPLEWVQSRIYGPLKMKEIARKGNDKKVGWQDQNWGWKANQI